LNLNEITLKQVSILEFYSQIQPIYRRMGMRGITSNQLNEFERLEYNIRECQQIIRTLQ